MRSTSCPNSFVIFYARNHDSILKQIRPHYDQFYSRGPVSVTGICSCVSKAGNWKNMDVTFLKTNQYGSE